MRVKSNRALHKSARLAHRAPASQFVALPAWRRPGFRIGAANTVAAAVAGILYGSSGTAYAQAAGAAAPATAATAQTSESLQEVVVTATAQSVKKLDASYNVVVADNELIKQANPKSSADILKLSPGIWPESSGGQTGANIEIAGFPGGGDAPFFTNMIEGMPMYGMPSLSFMDSSSFFRLDDTVERVEVVQGGPGALFGPGQMGATANYILKTGSETPTGSVGVTYGNEGLWRTDAFYGFKISEGWYGSVGGFYRVSDGVRPPSFPADDGGQLTATLKHIWDDGSLMFWGRVLNDKNQFIVPVPVVESATGSTFSEYPGFCALTCAYGSNNIRNVMLPNPMGGFQSADLGNGRGGNFYYFGSKFEQTSGTWSFVNNFLIDGGGLDTNALFSGPNPRPLSYYLYGCQVPQPTGYCSGGSAVDTNNLGAGGQGLNPALNVQATYAGSGVPVSPDQSVIQQGWWYIQKSLSNIADEFRVSKEIFGGNTLSLGAYLTKYSMNDNWSLGNQMLMANTPNTTAITLNYQTGADCNTVGVGNTCHLTSSQGFVNDNGNYNIHQHGNATNIAGYLSDSWKIGGWLIDAGARLEQIDARQRTCNRTNVQMGSIFDLWDNAVPICNGTYDYEHYQTTRPTYTGGINYEFTDHMSAYVRANTGNHFNDFDNNIRGAGGHFAPLQTVTNYEGGFKFQASWVYLDVNVYHRDFTGLQYTPTDTNGVPLVGQTATYGSTSKGVNFVGTVTPFTGFTVRVVGDYMDGHYEDFNGCAKYIDIFGNNKCAAVNGSPLQRQPKFQIRVTPSYTYPGSWGDASLWLTYEYVGQRYEDLTGLQPLGTYEMLSAGFIADVGSHWQARIQATNLSNQIGLTEGNARKAGLASGVGGVLMARPIEGREYNFTMYYKF